MKHEDDNCVLQYGMTDAHETTRTITEVAEYPAHEPRTESAEYRHNRHILLERLNLGCLVCGTREEREAHHWFEWSAWEKMDPQKMLLVLRWLDPYGFGHHKGDQPVESADDVRNLVVLCRKHHRLRSFGIHNTTFPFWLPQLALKEGEEFLVDKK